MKAFDNTIRQATPILSFIVIAIGASTIVSESLSNWGSISMTASLLLLLATAVFAWRNYDSFFSLAAHLYAVVLTGRLFSTLRLPEDMVAIGGAALDPLLLGETGPGIPSITWLSYLLVILVAAQLIRLSMRWKTISPGAAPTVNDWALTYLRVYVGLMFIAHFSGHVLAGPAQFQIFADYFAGVGFHIGGPMVVLAGLIEITVSIGLVFGLMTRISAVGAVLYLFFATLWGAHFAAGYVWVLPLGGWEFSALWMAVILVFAIVGGSQISLDAMLQKSLPRRVDFLVR